MEELTERVQPMRVTFKGGETYELDFSRESISFAEAREFSTDNVTKYPVTTIPELWFYAFRKNHRKLSRSQTDDLLKKVGGLTPEMLKRLLLLYNQAAMSNGIVQDEEDLEKNPEVTVEL